MKIKALAKEYKQYVIDLRRDFHKQPETGWNEIETSQRIKRELEKMEIPFVPIAETGVMGTIKGKKEGKTVALRTDMDALEIQEGNEIPYKSRNDGICHACGHDAHMAMLLGSARILNELKEEINGTVRLIFQPAEEALNGAISVIKEGGLEGVDGIFGMHIMGLVPVGMVSVGTGAKMASADRFKISIRGKGGHGAMPDQSVDSVVAASAIVMNLQSIVSREMSPAEPVVVSIGTFHAGTRFNIIAGTAELEGTTRCFNSEISKRLPGIIERIVKNTAGTYRAEAELEYISAVPPTVNNSLCAKRAESVVEKILGKDALLNEPPSMIAEDFSYFAEKVPGVYIFLGAMNEKKGASYANHHERFNIDEDALEIGTMLNAQYAIDFLKEQ